MADGLVSAVVETTLGILKSAVLKEMGLVWDLKDELNNLESTFGTIQLVLQDAEIKQRKNESIHDWLRKLKNAAYDAEDILDRISTEGLRRRLGSQRDLDAFPRGFLQNHNALKDLELDSLPVRTLSNVLDNLSGLKTLCLYSCSNLESLADGLKNNLNCLERLYIHDCNGLRSFPAAILESLPSLRLLLFQNCKKLVPLTGSLNWGPTLNSWVLFGLPELEYLPESLQLLSGIKALDIVGCERLCSLPNWLSSLESLSQMIVRDCEKLNSLPDGFNSLKSLRQLDIYGCPLLEKRCKKPMGEDWPKISDIPIIRINDKEIQRLDQ